MKPSTVLKLLKELEAIKASKLSISKYYNNDEKKIKALYNKVSDFRNCCQNVEEFPEVLNIYNSIKKYSNYVKLEENEDNMIFEYIRDENSKIQKYFISVPIKDSVPFQITLNREEMDSIYRLYSFYGDNLSQRVISRYFPDISLIDFKRILRAAHITKSSGPFARHMIEEKTIEELNEIQMREKENSFLRRAEEAAIKQTEKLLKRYAQENIELKRKIQTLSDISINLDYTKELVYLPKINKSNKNINLYLSDIHLGSYTISGSLYSENQNYGVNEVKRRLTCVLNKLNELGSFNTINLVLMGDMIDCCGFTGQTSRMDHIMPSNMDAREQANQYINLMDWFITSLVSTENKLCSNVRTFSVPGGNHDGEYSYLLNKALFNLINQKFPDIQTTLWEKYYGRFEQNNHIFYIMHGKDAQFMKSSMPLVLNDKTKVLLYEWVMNQNETGNNIHFIKGDLHSNSLTSCEKLDYRNVLSLYGASDYSNYNFSRNSYGISYDLFIEDNLIRGTFENM